MLELLFCRFWSSRKVYVGSCTITMKGFVLGGGEFLLHLFFFYHRCKGKFDQAFLVFIFPFWNGLYGCFWIGFLSICLYLFPPFFYLGSVMLYFISFYWSCYAFSDRVMLSLMLYQVVYFWIILSGFSDFVLRVNHIIPFWVYQVEFFSSLIVLYFG